jgi:hypothetical protein
MNPYTKKADAYSNLLSVIGKVVSDNEECLSDEELSRLWRLWMDVASISNINSGDDSIILWDNFYIPRLIGDRIKKYCADHNISEENYDGVFSRSRLIFKIDPNYNLPERKCNYTETGGITSLEKLKYFKKNLVDSMKVPPNRMPTYIDGTWANDSEYIKYLYSIATEKHGADPKFYPRDEKYIVNYLLSICNQIAVITRIGSGNVIIAGTKSFDDIRTAFYQLDSSWDVKVNVTNDVIWVVLPITNIKLYQSEHIPKGDVFIGYTPPKDDVNVTSFMLELISEKIIKANIE